MLFQMLYFLLLAKSKSKCFMCIEFAIHCFENDTPACSILSSLFRDPKLIYPEDFLDVQYDSLVTLNSFLLL